MSPRPSEIAVHKPKRADTKRIQRDGSLPEKAPPPKLVEVVNARKMLLDANGRALAIATLLEALQARDDEGNVAPVAVKAADVILERTDPIESQDSGEVVVRFIHERVIAAVQ
jgi:hypothetical protein